LRVTKFVRPMALVFASMVAIVAIACGGDAAEPAARPTSAPVATTAPMATAVPAAAATAAPDAPAGSSATAVPSRARATAVPATKAKPDPSSALIMANPLFKPEWGTPVYGGTMKMRTNMPVRSGGAFGAHGNSHYELPAFTMYGTLTAVDAWGGWSAGLEPELAKSWDISADGLTYTFHLREGIHFRSQSEYDKIKGLPGLGQEVTCDDVKSTFDFKGTERWFAEGGSNTVMIDGDTHTWTCPDGPEGYTVVVHIETGIPEPGLLMLLALPGANGIQNKEWREHVLENYPIKWIITGEFTAHVGTGPFLPQALQPEVVNKMIKNPDYWKPGLPFLDKFEFHTIPDPSTALAAFLTGKIDVMGHGSGSPYPAQVEQVQRDFPDKIVVPNHYYGARAMGFNTEKPPFDDVRVRRAVHLVTDRRAWHALEQVGTSDLYASVTAGFFNSEGRPHNPMGNSWEVINTWPGFRADHDQDIAEAQRLMDEVYGVGNRPGPFQCLTRADDTSINNCLYTGEMISQFLDMNLTVKTYDSATLTSMTAGCTWTFAPSVLPSWDATPDPYLRFRTYNSNIKGFRKCQGGIDADLQAKLNGLIDAMPAELDFNKRAAISREIEYLLYNEVNNFAPIGWQNLFTMIQPWLKGYAVADHGIHTGHITQAERAWIVR